MSRARRSKMPLGVVLVDIDHFKAVNDSAGHLAGDMVLKDVAQRMRSGLRIYDGVGRYGGEEFLLVLPGCDLESTTARADELRAKICAQPILIPDRSISVTVSMGTALADPSMTLEAVLQAADVALYSAKRRGRNRVESQLREPVAGSSR
jgi:diguanylate cyclase (GGDEF)-like protein